MIPSTATKFYCYQCECLCQIEAKKPVEPKVVPLPPKKVEKKSPKIPEGSKLFLCGTCKGKVCYQPGLSAYYKCTRCLTVNQVPA